jgi:hypothetical protein
VISNSNAGDNIPMPIWRDEAAAQSLEKPVKLPNEHRREYSGENCRETSV